MEQKRYRVAQWATGNVGLRSLKTVMEHPQLDLVGLYVYSDAKVGRDAGDLCDAPITGVIATRDIDDILEAEPDCVLYMPDQFDIDDMCRILESGANIVSTRMEFHHPGSIEPETRRRLEEACERGGTSLHSTGSSPGFATEVIPLALTSIARRLDCLTIEECADVSSRNSPEMLFRSMGFGTLPASLDATPHAGTLSATPSLRMTLEALHLAADDFTATTEFATARHRVEIAAGVVEAGTVAAQRSEITALRNGKPVLRRRTTWYVSRDLDPAWELRETGWHFVVEGDTPLDTFIAFPVTDEDYAAFTPGLTAHRPVNAIPYVCEAPPGIRTTADLPVVIANFGP
jgi:4-hydroxy-tetrahydrodipicolinate reductase